VLTLLIDLAVYLLTSVMLSCMCFEALLFDGGRQRNVWVLCHIIWHSE